MKLHFHFFKQINFTMKDWYTNTSADNDARLLATKPAFVCSLLKNGKKCIGFAVNTDVWSGGGIHWTCIFIDMRNEDVWTVEFYNSSGNNPSTEIKRLMDSIVKNIYLCNSKPYNTIVKDCHVMNVEHQKTDTECGVYCLFIIYCRCKNWSINNFTGSDGKLIPDKAMIDFRKLIFWNN